LKSKSHANPKVSVAFEVNEIEDAGAPLAELVRRRRSRRLWQFSRPIQCEYQQVRRLSRTRRCAAASTARATTACRGRSASRRATTCRSSTAARTSASACARARPCAATSTCAARAATATTGRLRRTARDRDVLLAVQLEGHRRTHLGQTDFLIQKLLAVVGPENHQPGVHVGEH
jgi:hypothetical protein